MSVCEHERIESCTYDEKDGMQWVTHLWYRCVDCGAEVENFAILRDFKKLVNVNKPPALRRPGEERA